MATLPLPPTPLHIGVLLVRFSPLRPGLPLYALALAVTLAGCGRPMKEAQGEEVSTAPPTSIEGALDRLAKTKVLTAQVERREMVRAISTTVNAVSEKEISIFPRTSGVVVDVAVEEGDRVAEGDVLMRLDPRELMAALDEAKIALREAVDSKRALELAVAEAESKVERAELTHEQSEKELDRKESAGVGIISQNELENLRLTVRTNHSDLSAQRVAKERAEAALASQAIAVERANLQIATAELNLSFTEVRAPFDGVIASRSVRLGDLASNSTAAFMLTDPDHVRAVVSRPQRELTFFRSAEERTRPTSDAGTTSHDSLAIEIEPEALPGEMYSGSILFVSPTIDAASGQFRVTLGVEQPGDEEGRPSVLPGMLLRVRIVTERHMDALAVPKRALLREGDTHFIFVADGDKARRVRVEEGFSTDEDVEVSPRPDGALSPGDRVIVVGNRDLEDGDSIEPSPWVARPGTAAPKGNDDA